MSKPILILKQPNERLEIKICAISSWGGFDELIQFLKNEYNAKVLSENDGPDARRWILESQNKKIELIHDDMYGNYLIAPTEDSEDIVYEIGKDLEERLKDDNEE